MNAVMGRLQKLQPLALTFLLVPAYALAQDAVDGGGSDGGANLELIHQLVLAVIPVLSTTITGALKKMVGAIPGNLLPLVSTVVGAAIGWLGDAFGIPGLQGAGIVGGGALGLGGVGVREAWNQNLNKKKKVS